MDNLSITHSADPRNNGQEKGKTALEKVQNTFTDEIVIGICSPIGTIKEPVIEEIKRQLHSTYKYSENDKPNVHVIKLSDFIAQHGKIDETPKVGKSKAFTSLMAKILEGDALRDKYQKNSILAELAVAKILQERKQTKEGRLLDTLDMKPRRICYIIDSLKNREELMFLRSVYKDIFYLFGIFSPEHERRAVLREKNLTADEIETLINTDEYENSFHGQNVRGTFVNADFFIRTSNSKLKSIDKTIDRYLRLIFENGIITPTSNEKAMYAARSAADNSACLSRQVGACITDSAGNILSTGWNDVPKFKGNLYSEDSGTDHRCFNHGEKGAVGFCRNDRQKDTIVSEIVARLLGSKEVKEVINPIALQDKKFQMNLSALLREQTPIKDLIEFSRAVHAEMHAIIVGSQQTGSKMVGGKLFTTTYPCHNCARHIIAAGITEVFFIEPYVKSLCLQLHSDAITESEEKTMENNNKVKILIYDGVAPRRYLDLFSMSLNRKQSNGDKFNVKAETLHPKFRLTLQALSTLEEQAVHSLVESELIK